LLLGGPFLVPTPSQADTRSGRDLADPDGRFATLAGIDVHHRVAGEPSDPTLVLLHHFYGSVPTWRHVQPALAEDHQVVAFDRPGFGLTERLPHRDWGDESPYTRATSARITLELLDHLGAERGVLIGSSAGGTAALETYARAPERVAALVLLSPAITGDVGAPSRFRPLLRSPQLRRLGPHVVKRVAGDITPDRVAGSWHDPSQVTDDDVAAYAKLLEVDGWAEGFWHLLSAEDPPDLRWLLPRIDVPTLVVSGASDRVIASTWNRRTAAAIPGARFEEIPACGHTPHEECPEQLLELIRRFLDDVEL
jgi:pimeloyl-ACP methyl ester carboxylesterase